MMKELNFGVCPLCTSNRVSQFVEHRHWIYFRCQKCDLIFLDKTFHLDPLEEKARYDLHNNDTEQNNQGYVDHLNEVVNKVVEFMPKGSNGLDFGSGPLPSLSKLLNLKGYKMDIYDPFYAMDSKVWNSSYAFVTLCEVIEHLSNPKQELEKIFKVLKGNGAIFIKTHIYQEVMVFKSWYYKNDPTHVSFFTNKTFNWIAEQYNMKAVFSGAKVVVLFKR